MSNDEASESYEEKIDELEDAIEAAFGEQAELVASWPDHCVFKICPPDEGPPDPYGEPDDDEDEDEDEDEDARYFSVTYKTDDNDQIVFGEPQEVEPDPVTYSPVAASPTLSDEDIALMYSRPGASGTAHGGKATLPKYVQKLGAKAQRQWTDVWNSAYQRCKGTGADTKTCEQKAFAQANGVVIKGQALADGITLANTTSKPWDGSASRFEDTEAYCRACLINENTGDPKDWTQDKCKLPVSEPDGTLNLNAVRAASSAMGGGRGGLKGTSPAAISKAMKALARLKKANDIGMEDDGDAYSLADAYSIAALRLADSGGALPEWQQIHYIGEWVEPNGSGVKIKFDRAMGQSFIRNFHNGVVRREIPLDERHETDDDGRALAWARDVRWGNDGEGLPNAPEPSGKGDILYVKWAYNRVGTDKLTDRQYQYISPQYRLDYVDKETGKHYGPTLLAVAATNNPFLRLRSIQGEPRQIAASDVSIREEGLRPWHEERDMTDEKLAEQMTTLSEQLANERTAREAIEARLAEERKQRHAREVDIFLDGQIRRGVPPAFVNKFRDILLASSPDAEAVITLDDAGTPTQNLHQAIRVALQDAPAIPLDVLTRPEDRRPDNTTKLDEQVVAQSGQDMAKKWYPERFATNGTH